jgi:hypothetical protein
LSVTEVDGCFSTAAARHGIGEPNDNPAAKSYQKAIFEQGIPATAFAVANNCVAIVNVA